MVAECVKEADDVVQDRLTGLVSVNRMAGAGDADGGAVGDSGFEQLQVTVADECAELGFAARAEGSGRASVPVPLRRRSRSGRAGSRRQLADQQP